MEPCLVTERHWSGREVFVTGGTGLIGSWMVKSLIASGARVTALVRNSEKSSELYLSGVFKQVNIVRGSVEDEKTIEKIFSETSFGAIFHLASMNDNRSLLNPSSEIFETNVTGVWNVFSAHRRHLQPECIILMTSSIELDRTKKYIKEQKNQSGKSLHSYHITKKCAEFIAESFLEQYGTNAVIVRLPNVFGGGDFNFSRIVPSVIRDLIRGHSPRLRSVDDVARRYIYVEDVVQALLLLAKHQASGRANAHKFDFRDTPSFTTTSLVGKISKEFGEASFVSGEELSQQGNAEVACGDECHTVESVGWREETGLVDGLRKTIEWYRAAGAVVLN